MLTKTKNHITFEFKGQTYKLQSKLYSEENNTITLKPKGCASIFKQYVKHNFSEVICMVSSDYNCVKLYLSDSEGQPLPVEDIKEIEQFCYIFRDGYFNSYEDILEHKNISVSTDCGVDFVGFSTFIFVNNTTKFGSLVDLKKTMVDWEDGRFNSSYDFSPQNALRKIKSYATVSVQRKFHDWLIETGRLEA